jgi:hypothetical protein
MRLVGTIVVAFGLVSCGPNGGLPPENWGKTFVVEIEAVPDKEIPTDGTIHVVKRGKFVIEQSTLFCGASAEVHEAMVRRGFRGLGLDGVKLRDVLHNMGQTMQHSDGSSRQRTLDGKHCFDDGKNATYSGLVDLNRAGKPYRLTLIVRQGDAFWQGTAERADGQFRPDIFIIGDDSPDPETITPAREQARYLKEALKQSIEFDAADLSNQFTDYLRR